MRRYYQILGVAPNATSEEIKAAWLFSIKAFHPDKFSSSSSQQQRIAHERTQAINEAYTVLSDPHKRSNYDREYAKQPRAEAASPNRASASPPPKPASEPPGGPAATSSGVSPDSPIRTHFLIRRLGHYLSFSGRIGRAQFVVRAIVAFLTFSIAVWLWSAIGKNTSANLVILPLVALFLYTLVVQAGKRLHDSDMSAAWVLFAVWGIGALVLIVFLLLPRTVGTNRFGSRPATPRNMKIAGSVFTGILLLGLCALLIITNLPGLKSSPITFSSRPPAVTSEKAFDPDEFLKAAKPEVQKAIELRQKVPAGHAVSVPPTEAPLSSTNKPLQAQTDHNEVWDLPKIASAARPSVVFVVVSDATGKATKTGTAFFVTEDGVLVTNWHVVSGGLSAVAKTEGGATYHIAGILAYSPKSDIALLKTDGRNVPFLTLDLESTVRVGDRVAAIGSPLGFEGTVSEGIVSSLRGNGHSIEWLQVTAAVSHGSSGSPVLNARGQVVGVATWVMSKEGAQALNFARPATYISALMEKLASNASPKTLPEVLGNQSDAAALRRTPEHPQWPPSAAVLSVEKRLLKEASVLRDQGDTTNALARLQNAAQRDPKDANVLAEMSMIYESIQLFERSNETWRKIQAIGPSAGVIYELANMKLNSFPPTVPYAETLPPPLQGGGNSTDSLRGERFPETRKRSLTLEEVRNWNDEKLRYAINEIYARHGAEIENLGVRNQFSGWDWYRPVRGKTYEATEADFSAVEKYNVHLLAEYRKALQNKTKQVTRSTKQSPAKTKPPPPVRTWPWYP